MDLGINTDGKPKTSILKIALIGVISLDAGVILFSR